MTIPTVPLGSEGTPAQVTLAWVHSRGDVVVPIPGTRRPSRPEENVGALEVSFPRSELDRLEPLSRQVVGARY
jgi:aryl-alcohol dehydrogenase-like predicted oxidoreductase